MLRIAHLTDTHLRHHLPGSSAATEQLSRAMPQLLERAMVRIRDEAPDLLVMSGDLLDFPFEAIDSPAMLELAERDLRMLAGILAAAGSPYVVVQGNHDVPHLVRRVFGHLPVDQVIAGHRVLCFNDCQTGNLYPERLGRERDRFLAALADPSSPPQVYVQHYLVWPRRNVATLASPYTYREAGFLLDTIVKRGLVRLVLSGHYHAGVPLTRIGGAYFAAVPAFAEAPHPYWIYDLDDRQISYQPRQLGEVAV
jgi:predicted MPP superfamily phosphohydrolase